MASKMTKAEKDRRKAVAQNAKAAKKKKEKSKSSSSSSSKLSNLVKNAIGGQKEKKTFAGAFEENTKKLNLSRKSDKGTVSKKETVKEEKRYNPLIKTPTRMQKDTSPEIDNFAESLVRKGAQGFEGALVGHSDRRNMKEAESYLTGDYKKRFMPGVKTGLRMQVDDPSLVKKAKAQAKKEGFDNLTEWEINKANEAVHRTDDYYKRKAELDADVEAQNYNKFVKWMPEAAEVIGSMIPTMAAGAATGGIGGMAGLTGRTMAALQHVVTGGEISGRVSGQEARMMYDAVLAEKNKTNLNIDDYRDAIKKANTTGELVGLAEAGTEMLFGGIAFMGKGLMDHTAGKIGFELLSPATKASVLAWRNTTAGRISTAVAQRLGGSIGEGMEEAIMSLAQPAIESNVAGVDSEFSINDMIRDFGMGAAVSMVLGMPVTMADTADATQGRMNHSRMQKELQNLFSEKAQELVRSGQISEKDAANINAQISDLRKGKGSLMQSEVQEETKVTGEELDAVYANFDEAREAMMAEAKNKQNGEKVTARFIDENGEAQLWQTYVNNGRITAVTGGTTTKAESAKYAAKAQRVAQATNTAERTGYQLNVKDEIVQQVSALSKAFGKEVEFIRDARTNVHGYEEGGKIFVNVNSTQSPAAAVVAHEMTHLLENTSSYKRLQDMAFRFYGSSLEDKRADIADIYKGVKALYNDDGTMNTAFVDTEVMAAFVEEKLLNDAETIKQVVKEDRTLAQKIVDWINKVIQKITGTKEQRFLIEARDMWNKALQEEKNNKKAPENGADKRFSFGGEKALTADLDALANAKDMLKDNQSAETIFRETGWFVGADGKWRFEIDDSDMVYTKQGKRGNFDQERQKELYDKMFSGTITQKEWDELALLEKSGVRKQTMLEDYIDHQSLFDAYPQLRNINLEFSAEDLGRSGAYNKYDNTITLDVKYKSAPESVLLHEIQHAIQSIEGFSGGTNPEAWAIRDLDGSITKRFADEYKELYAGISRENQNKYQRYKELEFAMGEILYSEKKSDQERMERYEEESDTLYAELYYKPWFLRLDTLYRMLNNTSSLYSYLYRNTAGEIEARDVAKRRNLTANERKVQMPETGNENTVFAESDISNIIKKDKYGIPFVEVTSDILNGVSKKDIPKVLAQIVKTKFNVWVDANGQKIGINKKTANEWRFSENAKWLYRGNKRKFRDKMRTFDNADELLKASRSYIEEEAIHKNYESYARGEVNFRVDGREYNADILVGIDKQNRAFLYDIVNIGTIKIEEAHTTLAENSADRSNGASSMDSISDSIEKSNNRFSISRSKDAAYLDAVNRGDMETAQRMVDEAAKKAGYAIKAWHGTPKYGFTVFDHKKIGSTTDDGMFGHGFYFSSDKRVADFYARAGGRTIPVFLKIKKAWWGRDHNDIEKVSEELDIVERSLREIELPLPGETIGGKTSIVIGPRGGQERQFTEKLKGLGYDSVIVQHGGKTNYEYVVFNPNQIKSADPVTYDDEGNVIPLSERFNSSKDDIRWSMGRSTKTELNDLIKSHGTAMREVFHNRKRADHKELWDMIKDEVSHIVQTGAARRDMVDEIVRIAYETGYINNAVESEELGENTWGKGIYIPEEYKGEMASLGGLRSINGQLRNSGLFLTYNRTKKGSDVRYGGLDEAYSDLQASNPVLPDTIDPAEQVEALIELFSKGSDRRTLEELDEEAYAMGEENAPYLTSIRNTVEEAMDDIATFARWKMMQDSREEGIQEGLKRGKKSGAAEQERKQRKLDEATLREFDKLNKQRAEDERKQDEATMRMHDRLIKEVYNEAKSLSAEEKRDIRRAVREKGEEKMKKELAKRAAKYRKERSNARQNLNAVMKEAEKQAKNYERKLSAQEKEAMRKKREKTDQERRAERLRIVKEEYKRNAPKPAEGSAEAKYLESNSAKELIGRFRRNVITYLVEHKKFISPNEGVVLDENGMEIAYLNRNEEWDISKRKNTYTPSWGLTLLAEKEGMDKDLFFTIYSKIADMRTKRNKQGRLEYKKEDVVKYIGMLDLTVKQKDFLYFDVVKYAYATKPTFLAGGAIKEMAGNTRGRMMAALDNIAVDMYAGAMKDIDLFDAESSAQIQYKDIAAFADAVYGKEDSNEKDDFIMFFCGSIMDYSAEMEKVRLLEKTNLLTDKPKEKNSVKMQILRAYRESKRLFVAEGEAFERMSEKLKNPLITARYYGAKKSSAIANEMIYGKTQRDLQGKKHGKSLYEIFKPVFRADEKAGNNNKMKELTELVNCRHDIYRLRNGKGYTGYSIEECERIVDRISREHPELLKVADEIAEYGRVLLRMCVESGRISEADYQYFTAKYPYYAPTFRLRSNEYIDRKGNVVRRDTKVIRTAVGGNDDVLPLFDQFVRRTQEIVKACKKNQLATELARAYTLPNSAEYIRDVRMTEKQEDKEKDIASLGEVEDIGRARKEDGNENIIPWYSNGKKYDIEVEDEALLFGWDRITYRRNEYAIATAFRKMNNIRRGVLTQYNPTFWLTNGIKDIQDMYLYNQHAQRLPKFHLEAAKTMFAGTFGKGKNEDALEEYLSFGMSQASIFEYDNTNSGRRTKKDRVAEVMRKPIEAFNALNFMVEQTPRLAVYNEAVDRLEKQRRNGGNTYTDEEIKTIASYQASDATLNFGRSGTVIKEMNTYGFTFLNAGVQGMDRFRRMFTQIRDGNKKAVLINVCGLIVKLGIVGVGWNVLTDWIYGGDDEYAEAIREALYGEDADKVAQEYAEMADYQRTNYLMLNVNGTWIRIPKGRLASFIYGFVYNGEKVYSGEMDALDLITAQMDLASETILFSNPITNNIMGPFVDVWRNKDAWDVAIVSEYEDMGEGFHYLEHDEETTDLAIKVAEFGHYLTADLFGVEDSRILDISPKKLDYLIEQYLGSYANMIMPFLSKEQNLKDNALGALESMIKKFYIDPTSSNRLAGDYYDLKEEFENIANAHESDSPYAVASKVFGDYDKELKALRDEMDVIVADTSLSRKERLAQISELRGQMNDLYRQGILDAKDALGFATENYYGKEENSETYENWENLTKGYEWQISNLSESAQEKWSVAESSGVDPDSFIKAYNFLKDVKADKDENGKSINGSKKAKVTKYLNGLELTAEQKLTLYYELGGYSKNGDIPAFSNGSVGSTGLSASMVSPVAGGGRISSGFGYRNTGIPGASTYHQAVDIAAPAGTDVGASITGTVTRVSSSGGYGNSVEITSTDENGNTIVTKYSHLLNFGVEVGDVVSQGKKIGEIGSTGTSSGNHLDFKLAINGEWVDPTQYVDLAGAGIVDSIGYTVKKNTGGSSSVSGGSSGRSYGGSGGGSGSKVSVSSTQRTETKYDSITKISGNSKSAGGNSSYSGRGFMLPTASEIAEISSRNVTGRSTKAPTYGKAGVYLPKASDYGRGTQRSIGTSLAKTQRTQRTGGSLWDDSILS